MRKTPSWRDAKPTMDNNVAESAPGSNPVYHQLGEEKRDVNLARFLSLGGHEPTKACSVADREMYLYNYSNDGDEKDARRRLINATFALLISMIDNLHRHQREGPKGYTTCVLDPNAVVTPYTSGAQQMADKQSLGLSPS